MLNNKTPAEELDASDKKRLQNIVAKFLYYARAIVPTILFSPKSLVVVQEEKNHRDSKKSLIY